MSTVPTTPTPARLKLVAYLRVSTDVQAEHGLGLDVQRQAIRSWAKAAGHRIVAWHADEGVSGSNGLDRRMGLLDALAALKAHQAAGVVVYRLDRLARDLIVQETLLAEVRRLGADVHSTSPAEAAYLVDDPDDPSRRLIRQVLGAVSEYERAMITLRLRAGRRLKAERGGYGGGGVPYGRRAEDRALVADHDEAEAVTMMAQLRAAGASYRTICAALAAAGHQPRRGGSWQPAVVRRVLLRQAVAA